MGETLIIMKKDMILTALISLIGMDYTKKLFTERAFEQKLYKKIQFKIMCRFFL